MITDTLLGLLFAAVTPLLTLLSWSAPPVGDFAGAAVMGSQAGQANRYLPLDQFLVLIVAGLAFDLVCTGAQFGVWLYRLIPFKAT